MKTVNFSRTGSDAAHDAAHRLDGMRLEKKAINLEVSEIVRTFAEDFKQNAT